MSDFDTSISVLIPDGEVIICPNVVNCLSRIENIKIFIISNKLECPIRYSRHIDSFQFLPKTEDELDWINNINNAVVKHDIDIIMPIFTDAIESVIKYKYAIRAKNKLNFFPTINDFKIADCKFLLSNHLLDINLPFPKSLLLDFNNLESLNDLCFPIIVKPLEGVGGGGGMNIFNDFLDLKQYFSTINYNIKYLAQEYISGYDIDCNVICKSGEILAFTIQKAFLNNDNSFGPAFGVEFVEERRLYDIVKKLMKSLLWSGVAHIDLRFDEKLNEFKVIEINPRFWGSTDASLLAGINFPELYCLASLDREFNTPKYKNIRFLNLKGLKKTLKRNPFFIFRFDFIIRNTSINFFIKDPLPTFFNLMSRTKFIFRS